MHQDVTKDAVEGEMLTPIPRKQGEAITMDFPDAIRKVIDGKKIRRFSWDSQTDHGVSRNGWLCIYTKGQYHTWSINDGDLEANDWYVMPESN